MKTKTWGVLVIAVCLLVTGCKPATQKKSGQPLQLDVVVEGIDESFGQDDPAALENRDDGPSKVITDLDPATCKVFVKAFQSETDATNKRRHIPDLNDTSTLSDPFKQGHVAVLQKAANNTWYGTINILNSNGSDPAGAVTLLAYAMDNTGRHLYSGTYAITNIATQTTIVSIAVTGASDGTTAAYSTTVGAANNLGPGGGYVFHDATNYTAGWRYMEIAAPTWNTAWGTAGADPTAAWASSGGTYLVTGTAIGTGKENTAKMNTTTFEAGYACLNKTVNDLTGWFLPSDGELALVTTTPDTTTYLDITPASKAYYWSSSENTTTATPNNTTAYAAYYKNSGRKWEQQTPAKNGVYHYRPARRF